jgi:hypothetical protein
MNSQGVLLITPVGACCVLGVPRRPCLHQGMQTTRCGVLILLIAANGHHRLACPGIMGALLDHERVEFHRCATGL